MADLTDLETFVAVARTGSFAATARQLRVTPALVGRRIAGLEERYGARLIERTTRSQRLTELGERFHIHAESVIAAVQELDDLVHPAGTELRGRIRISGPTTLGVARLAGLVAAFSAANPAVTLELHLADRRVDLIAEGFDLAVRIGHPEPSGLIARRIGTYAMAVCAAPSFLARHGRPGRPDDLAATNCILNLNLVPRNQWTFLATDGQPITVEVSGGLQMDNDLAQRTAALGGSGVAYLPFELVRDDLAAGGLEALLPEWRLPALPIHVVRPTRRFTPRSVS